MINCLSNGGLECLHWSTEFLIKDISTLLSCFCNISFVWAPRKANRIAHLVGKWVVNYCFAGPVDVSCLPSTVLSQLFRESDPQAAT